MNTPTSDTPWRPEVISGERIFLSHILREDVLLLARWFYDLELTAYLGRVGMSFTHQQEQEWFENYTKDPAVKTFAIIVRERAQFIGSVTLMHINHQHGTAELGIAIGDKAAWGQGYGSEAVRLMTDYGFTFLGLHAIHLWHTSFNQRGHHAYLKAGYKVAGRRREAALFDGQRYDHILMDITREEFGPSRLRGMIEQLGDE
jgi:RimJ/RimL family protein N-acetyltransferase